MSERLQAAVLAVRDAQGRGDADAVVRAMRSVIEHYAAPSGDPALGEAAVKLAEVLGPVGLAIAASEVSGDAAVREALRAGGFDAPAEQWSRLSAALADVDDWIETGDSWTESVPEREWLVPGWLPTGRVAMLSGEGGTGKSRLAVQLAAALAGDRLDWIEGGPKAMRLATGRPRTAVVGSWEDEPEQIGRWLAAAGRAESVGNRLRYVGLVGPVWGPHSEGSRHTSTSGQLTPLGQRLRERCEAVQARLLVLDPRAAAFGLNENDRALVRGFMASWDAWARRARCAVLIVAHPPKNESAYSGSSDWHAASRSVLTLKRDKENDTPSDAVVLRCLKSSYGALPEPVTLEGWPFWRAVQAQAPVVRGRT